jgi:hypothetical protein
MYIREQRKTGQTGGSASKRNGGLTNKNGLIKGAGIRIRELMNKWHI